MHFQVEKANEFRSFLFFAPSFLLRSTYLLPLGKRTTSPLFLNKTPSPFFHTLAYFFYPFSSWRGLGREEGCLVARRTWYPFPSPPFSGARSNHRLANALEESSIGAADKISYEAADRRRPIKMQPIWAESSRVESSHGKFYIHFDGWKGAKRKTCSRVNERGDRSGAGGKNFENRVS